MTQAPSPSWLLFAVLCGLTGAGSAWAAADGGGAEPEVGPHKALVVDFEAQEADRTVARTVTDLVSVQLSKVDGLEVIAGEDLRRVMELEADRQALGCDITSRECTAEIAGALGADLVFFGNVARLGTLYVITLGAMGTRDVKVHGREVVQVEELSALPAALSPAVDQLIEASGFRSSSPASGVASEPASSAASGEPPFGWGWAAAPLASLPLGGAGVAAGTALVVLFGVLPVLRAQHLAALDSPTAAEAAEAERLRNDFVSGGFVLPLAGAGLVVASALVALFGAGLGAGLFTYRELASPTE